MAHIVLEQSFSEPVSDATYSQFAQRLDPCLDLRRGTWVRSYFSADRTRIICEFEAPDAESVRDALRIANVPFDRVWRADVFAVEHYPELRAKLERLRAQRGGA
jgi:Nickel responsive protein SCO4226-like